MPRSCGSPPQRPVMVRTRRHVGTRVPRNQRRTTDGERSEEHTSELQSRLQLVCRLLLEKNDSAPTGVEAVFAGLLAAVLHIDRVSVDSPFFDDLGADSLAMAHFGAPVRKRANLPSASTQ